MYRLSADLPLFLRHLVFPFLFSFQGYLDSIGDFGGDAPLVFLGLYFYLVQEIILHTDGLGLDCHCTFLLATRAYE